MENFIECVKLGDNRLTILHAMVGVGTEDIIVSGIVTYKH